MTNPTPDKRWIDWPDNRPLCGVVTLPAATVAPFRWTLRVKAHGLIGVLNMTNPDWTPEAAQERHEADSLKYYHPAHTPAQHTDRGRLLELVKRLHGYIDRYMGQPDQTLVADHFFAIESRNKKLNATIERVSDALDDAKRDWRPREPYDAAWDVIDKIEQALKQEQQS